MCCLACDRPASSRNPIDRHGGVRVPWSLGRGRQAAGGGPSAWWVSQGRSRRHFTEREASTPRLLSGVPRTSKRADGWGCCPCYSSPWRPWCLPIMFDGASSLLRWATPLVRRRGNLGRTRLLTMSVTWMWSPSTNANEMWSTSTMRNRPCSRRSTSPSCEQHHLSTRCTRCSGGCPRCRWCSGRGRRRRDGTATVTPISAVTNPIARSGRTGMAITILILTSISQWRNDLSRDFQ